MKMREHAGQAQAASRRLAVIANSWLFATFIAHATGNKPSFMICVFPLILGPPLSLSLVEQFALCSRCQNLHCHYQGLAKNVPGKQGECSLPRS